MKKTTAEKIALFFTVQKCMADKRVKQENAGRKLTENERLVLFGLEKAGALRFMTPEEARLETKPAFMRWASELKTEPHKPFLKTILEMGHEMVDQRVQTLSPRTAAAVYALGSNKQAV